MARRLATRAYRALQQGLLRRAAQLYRSSLRVAPTAEAWAGLGWIHGQCGNLEQAIDCSRRAIQADPGLGNSYSQIGACLVRQQRFQEAVPWFRRAARAPRYADLGCIYFELGAIQERLGDERKALQAYACTLAESPRCPLARQAWQRLVCRRN